MASYADVVSVKVKPDTSSFRKELRDQLAAIKQDFVVQAQLQIDTAKATSSLDAWRKEQGAKSINQKVDLDKSFADRLKSATSDVSKLNSGFSTVARTAASAALSIGGLAAGMRLAATVGPVLIQASGALGLLPGVAAAAGAALLTVKLGADGIKKAFDPVRKQFDGIKTSVSAAFQKGLTPALKQATAVIPTLKTGFSGIATEMSGVAQRFIQVNTSKQGLSDIGSILTNTKNSTGAFGDALTAVAATFRIVAAEGSNWLPGFANGINSAAERMRQFVDNARQSGQLTQWIQGGIDAFKQIFSVLKNIGSIVGSVFKGLQAGGAGIGGVFGSATKSIADFLKSTQGMSVLKGIGQTITVVGNVVRDVLNVALRQAAPAIQAALPGIKQFAQQIGAVLLPAIRVVGPIIKDVFGWLSRNMGTIGPIIIGIVAAFKAWSIISGILNLVLDANPIVLIIAAIVAGVALIITNWTAIKNFFIGLWNTVSGAFQTAWNAIVGFLTAVWAGIVGVAQSVWGAISGFFSGLWNGIKDVALSVWDAITGFLTAAWNGIKGVASAVWNGIASFFSGLWNGIKNVASSVWNAITGFLSNAWNGIKNTASSVWNGILNFFRSVWNGVRSAVSDGINSVVSFFSGLPGKILRALGSLGNTLLSAGKDLLTGLWNGIQNAASWLWGKITSFFGNLLPGWVKDILGIHSPSRVFADIGVFLPQGMAKGIEKGTPAVKSAATAMATAATDAVDTLTGSAFNPSFTTTASTRLNSQLETAFALTDFRQPLVTQVELDGKVIAKSVNQVNLQNRKR